MDNNKVIHYVKPDEIYGVYGSITLIFLVLLIWYFVRSNLFVEDEKYNKLGGNDRRRKIEGMFPLESSSVLSHLSEWNGFVENVPRETVAKHTENNYCGSYGDVPVCLYDVSNTVYKPTWDHQTTMFLPNSRTLFKQSSNESIVWTKGGYRIADR